MIAVLVDCGALSQPECKKSKENTIINLEETEREFKRLINEFKKGKYMLSRYVTISFSVKYRTAFR